MGVRIVKPTKKKSSSQENISTLKKSFLGYYRTVPVKRYAAAHVGRSEDAVRSWEREDSDFSAQINKLKSAYILKNIKKIKSPEWLLERLVRDTFSPKSDLAISDERKYPAPIYGSLYMISDHPEITAKYPNLIKDLESAGIPMGH